jgi:ferredoxin-NADP reductase
VGGYLQQKVPHVHSFTLSFRHSLSETPGPSLLFYQSTIKEFSYKFMHTVEILSIKDITHDVRSYMVEKPDGYEFTPGHATEVALNKEGWRDEKRPFTFTSLNEDKYLEFTIKSYFDHDGMTQELYKAEEGDELLIDDPWGTIEYKGPGTFIAGGAGVTPFIAIIRDLAKRGELDGNRLIFSNKTEKDIILRDEFEKLLGDHFINAITHEESSDHFIDGFIDKEYLQEQIDDFDQHFYVCGPMAMVTNISKQLEDLGADPDGIVFEE